MIFSLCEIIGIKTLGDLERFKKEYMKNQKDIVLALLNYLMELGWGFRINEENNL